MRLQPAERRRRQSRDAVRREILDASEALIVESGYEGFSMRKLALRCGYTAPTIYHHFGDKTGLIDALLEARLGKLVQSLRRAPLGSDPVENLRLLSRAFARFGLRHPIHYQLLTEPRVGLTEPPPLGEQARLIMEQPLVEIAARGWLAQADLAAARQSIWATLHGLISLQAARTDVEWHPELLELCLDAIVRGWLVPASERSDERRALRGGEQAPAPLVIPAAEKMKRRGR